MSTKPRTHFGDQLRLELDRQRLSIRKLAHTMAPANPEPMRRNLARWIGGYNQPSRIHRVMVADALGVPLETFDEDDEESDPVSLDEFLRLRVREALQREGREVILELLHIQTQTEETTP
jgi:transcriptional regulator with XRE-family HTH domain